MRVISSIGGYAYSQSDDTIRVNQYLASRGEVMLGSNTIVLTQETDYPWDGDIGIVVQPEKEAEFEVKTRKFPQPVDNPNQNVHNSCISFSDITHTKK